MRSALLRRVAVLVAVLPALFALVVLRTLSRGEAEMAASDRAFDAGELEPALRHARRAASAYVPGAAHVDAAYARLRALASGAERGRDLALATRAWDAVRAGAIDSRHAWSPRARELELADENLARLRGAPRAGLSAPGVAPVAPGWVLLLVVGFFGALASSLWFCFAAWSAGGQFRPGRARWPALSWCAGILALGWALLHA